MTTTTVDLEAIRQKYALERDKRLRPDGQNQYIRMADEFAHYRADPHTPFVERPPVTDHVTFAFIGGGWAGLVTGARLKEAGVTDVRIIDRAGDFGGTWYWNRYPGAMCDTSSLVYMPLLEETNYMPTEKYAHGPEILDHARRIATQYGLYEYALFHTDVKNVTWQEDKARWLIETDRGDAFTAQFVGIGTGPMNIAKLPGLPGIKDFKGHSFHTSRWDYNYTGGSPEGAPLSKLSDKRVAVIGTGASAVQVIPELARTAQALYVFQRTPSSVDVRDNGPIDPDWFKSIATPGWQTRWLENFTTNTDGILNPDGQASEDLVQDGWTDLGRRMRAALASVPAEDLTPERIAAAYEAADVAKMNAIRERAEQLVQDPRTAESLKAWYRQMCKRPCFHDEYLQAFNSPNTHLIDTDGKGAESITEKGVVANGVEYEVDLIVFASGFDVTTGFSTAKVGFELTGRGGLSLADYWAKGMRTLHGLHAHNFPNAFIVQMAQGAFSGANVPHGFVDSSRTIAAVVAQALRTGSHVVEATEEAEEAWVAEFRSPAAGGRRPMDCTPGYYNNEGQPGTTPGGVGYPKGASAFFKLVDGWRKAGTFEGLSFQ